MTSNEIRKSVIYLEELIDRFLFFKANLETSTNLKDRNKYNELLFDKMIEAKEYINEYGIYRFASHDAERAENIFLTGLTKPKYFVKDLRGLISKLESKLN